MVKRIIKYFTCALAFALFVGGSMKNCEESLRDLDSPPEGW